MTMAIAPRLGLLLVCLASTASACTMITIGPKATKDGSTLAIHTDDAGWGAADYRMVKVPARDHAPGAQRAVYAYAQGYPRLVATDRGAAYAPRPGADNLTVPLGYIPEVAHTFAYFDQDYGMINEQQLALAESTTTARTAGWALNDGGHNLFGIGALSRIALERCASARCAIATMGALAVQHGFFCPDVGDKSDPDYTDAGEALGIVDRHGEHWEFNILTGPGGKGAIWAAQRLPPDGVHVNANDYTIRKLNLSDTDNFMASPNIVAIATAQGWYDPARDGPQLDFWATFAYHEPGQEFFTYATRRVWRVYSLVAPSRGFKPNSAPYPIAVTPDAKLGLDDVFRLLRDFYEGTPYDLTTGIAAGPFGSPIRYDTGYETALAGGFERAISIDRGLFSFVAAARPSLPDAVGGVVWYGWDAPVGSVYHPLYVSQAVMPTGYDVYGKQSVFESQSPWRPWNVVNNWSLLRFDRMRVDIAANVATWEQKGFAVAAQADAAALAVLRNNASASAAAGAAAAAIVNPHADAVVAAEWDLLYTLLAKYANNYRLSSEGPTQGFGPGQGDWEEMGYPDWWLNVTEWPAYPGVLPAPYRSALLAACDNDTTPTTDAPPRAQDTAADDVAWEVTITVTTRQLRRAAVVVAGFIVFLLSVAIAQRVCHGHEDGREAAAAAKLQERLLVQQF